MRLSPLPFLLSAAPIVSITSASVLNNLNYRSFSTREDHSHLGIDVSRLMKRQSEAEPPLLTRAGFSSGLASGDPTTDSVVLWTRLSPCGDPQVNSSDDDNAIKDPDAEDYAWPIYGKDGRVNDDVTNLMGCVTYKIWKKGTGTEATAPFKERIYTSKEVDWTVKVIPTGLEDFTQYNYRFYMCDKETEVMTEVGTTKTLPTAASVPAKGLKFNIYTCANWPWGFYNGYATPIRKQHQPDYILHLGDYIYESPQNFYKASFSQALNRLHDNTKGLMSLKDFRNRYRLYRTDGSLRKSHAAFPFINVWDDHETGDNSWKDSMGNFDTNRWGLYPPAGRPTYQQVKRNSVRAFFEWMPIRQQEYENNLRIWRSFKMGNLIDLFMLDTRLYNRDLPMYTGGTNRAEVEAIMNDPDPIDVPAGTRSRTIIGADQEKWFVDNFKASTATWQIIGNQVIFSNWGKDYDKWQGYPAARANIMKAVKDTTKNTVFLAGDSHENWAFDVREVDKQSKWVGTYNPKTGNGAIAVEFGVTGLTSPGPSGGIEHVQIPIQNDNAKKSVTTGTDGLMWRESWYRGYSELVVNSTALVMRYIGTPCQKNVNSIERVIAEFEVEVGAHKLKRQSDGLVSRNGGVAAGGLFGASGPVDVPAYDLYNQAAAGTPVKLPKGQTWEQICGANGVFTRALRSKGCELTSSAAAAPAAAPAAASAVASDTPDARRFRRWN